MAENGHDPLSYRATPLPAVIRTELCLLFALSFGYNEDMEKITIRKLPETKEIDGAKRWQEEKGEFAQISYMEDIKHLAYFELKKGHFRGNHYHEKKEEVFYVISGAIRAIFMDMDTLDREEYILTGGDKVSIKTRLGHIFHGVEDAVVVEYSYQYYDKEDGFRINLGD